MFLLSHSFCFDLVSFLDDPVNCKTQAGMVDPALLIPSPGEGFDEGGVKDVVKYEVGTFVGLEQIPVADHISDYESDQSDEAMAAAEQQVHYYMKHRLPTMTSNSCITTVT